MIPPTSEFVAISPNPFIVGNPVRDPSMFFGREAEFALVAKRFGQSNGGCLMVFCGERRSGKTSILLQIQQGRLGPDYVPVLIDMQAMAVEGEIEFLSRIATEIVKQLGAGPEAEFPDFLTSSKPSAAFLSFVDSVLVRYPKRKLVLLFDEYELFEDKIDGGALTPDILLVLSTLMENSEVFLVFTGSQHLDERRREYWRILHKAHEYRHISYLQPSDAVRLIRDPVAGRVTYDDDVVDRIVHLTAGQPFYTQAICRNLVDTLNDERTTVVTGEMLDAVVEHIVNYPFPQMTFLWESLDREQRLTLALLAQALEDGAASATVHDLRRTIRDGRYGLKLGRSAIATALEALFRHELLTKNDARDPGYAFRMDLWRRWVRRMHSVWRVMRESGLDPRSRGWWSRNRVVAIVAAAVVAGGVALAILPPDPEPQRIDRAPTPPPAMAFASITPVPADARLYQDGAAVAVGPFRGSLLADRDHEFAIRAPGYVDSTFTLRLAEADTHAVVVSLRPQRGGLRIEADPPEARIFLNGREIGTGAAEQDSLPVPEENLVEIRLEGFHPRNHRIRVNADTTVTLALPLSPVTVDFSIVTSPDRAEILVDGAPRGHSPLVVPGLPVGEHRFQARRAGYVPVDTTLTIDRSASHLKLELPTEPPGVLIVRGDHPARIYINDRQIGSGELPSSGETRVVAGSQKIEIVFRDGESDQMTIDVRPEETVELLWKERKLQMLARSGE